MMFPLDQILHFSALPRAEMDTICRRGVAAPSLAGILSSNAISTSMSPAICANMRNRFTGGARLPRLRNNPLLAVSVMFLCCADRLGGQPQPKETRAHPEKSAVMASRRPYRPPPTLSSRDPSTGEVTATLEILFSENDLEDVVCIETGELSDQRVRTRTYNRRLVGGIIRARDGDRLKVLLKNSISPSEPDVPYQLNEPNGFNITNLHTHGLHVSPEGNSDNVFLELGPGQSKQLCFDIPKGHTAGTFWYHAHRHGSTALQLTSGMAGPLLVEGGLDEVPEIAAAMKSGREKILVFQQITFSLDAQGLGRVTREDVYGPAQQRLARLQDCTQFEATLINGVHRPVIRMKPGEIQRWRCIHAGVIASIPLSIVSAKDDANRLWLYEIARDGIPLYRMEKVASVELYPGYRSDFLVQAPRKPGKYLLKQEAVSKEKGLNRLAQEESYLARIDIVDAPAVSMSLPAYHATAPFAPLPIDHDELANRRPMPLVFEVNERAGAFLANGEEFDHAHVRLYPRLGTAEEWAISSVRDTHPFHIHVNPFEVFERTSSGVKRYWRDTIVVTERNPPWDPIYVRMRFENFAGKTVLHCHNLMHEDRGMMMAVQIVGNSASEPCDDLAQRGVGRAPVESPPWALNDSSGQLRQSADFRGAPLLIVFFRGLGCGHCRQQLDAVAKRLIDFRRLGLEVIAICPDPPAELAKALRTESGGMPRSITLLSDERLTAFRRFGCYERDIRHGVFLVDSNGVVRWQHIGDEPFMGIEEIVGRARALE